MNYYKKYCKYKNKYLQLINQIGGNQLTIILKKSRLTDAVLYKIDMEISPEETINDIICKLIEKNIIIENKKLIKEFFTSFNYTIENQKYGIAKIRRFFRIKK